MIRAYFDSNVFSPLSELEGGLTTADLEKIRSAVRSGAVTIFGSSPLLEETAATINQSREMYRRHMATVLELIDRRRLIKSAEDILRDDCYNYAVGLGENDRTMPATASLMSIFERPEDESELLQIVAEGQRRRAADTAWLNAVMAEARADRRWAGSGRRYGTDELWNELGRMMVASWVDRCRPEVKKRCYKRGLGRMLGLKSFRFYALYFVSVTYTGLFGMSGDPRKVRHGDLHDWHHAVCASAANVFVTLESKTRPGHLGHALGLKQTPRFEVLNLWEFLDRI
jgi:hypothetical protein